MKQFVDCGTIEAARELCKRIKEETGMTWNEGKSLSKVAPLYSTIGFDSANENGITCGWSSCDGKRVSPDYFILSLKIDALKKQRKALKAKEVLSCGPK